jgi:hypothetical protein
MLVLWLLLTYQAPDTLDWLSSCLRAVTSNHSQSSSRADQGNAILQAFLGSASKEFSPKLCDGGTSRRDGGEAIVKNVIDVFYSQLRCGL